MYFLFTRFKYFKISEKSSTWDVNYRLENIWQAWEVYTHTHTRLHIHNPNRSWAHLGDWWKFSLPPSSSSVHLLNFDSHLSLRGDRKKKKIYFLKFINMQDFDFSHYLIVLMYIKLPNVAVYSQDWRKFLQVNHTTLTCQWRGRGEPNQLSTQLQHSPTTNNYNHLNLLVGSFYVFFVSQNQR